MKVLIAFESSGATREAFRALGHHAYSCDLLPADDDSAFHYQGDAFDAIEGRTILGGGWDLIVAHPPCTHLCVAGNRWHAGTPERAAAVDFVVRLAASLDANTPRWAIENPVGVLSTQWRKPNFYVQPWQFGHGETKRTGFWTSNLAPLVPTDIVDGREQRIWKMGPSPERWKERSKTFQGIADAIAEQWSY